MVIWLGLANIHWTGRWQDLTVSSSAPLKDDGAKKKDPSHYATLDPKSMKVGIADSLEGTVWFSTAKHNLNQ